MGTAARWVVVGLLALHGAIHVLGAAKGLGWAEISALKEPISRAAAFGWAAAAVLVLASAVLVALSRPDWWWLMALTAAATSQTVILTSWADAKAGTAANIVLLMVAGYGFLSIGPASFHAEWNRHAADALRIVDAPTGIVTDADLAALPEQVARYVRRSGAVGQPHVSDFYATLHGRIRSSPDEPWMTFTGHQLNTYGPQPRRLFYIDATMKGLPVTVFHVYEQHATMRGRLLSLVPILDAGGPEMDQGETVTMLNDLVAFAPAALVDAPITWTTLDEHRVSAVYTVGEQTVSAQLVFDDDGDLVDFVSDDRSRASTDGNTFTRLRWNTPLNTCRRVGGWRAATRGRAMWAAPQPEGHFSYADMVIDDITYNITDNVMEKAASTDSAPLLPAAPGR